MFQSNGWAVPACARPGFLEDAAPPGSLGLLSLVPEPQIPKSPNPKIQKIIKKLPLALLVVKKIAFGDLSCQKIALALLSCQNIALALLSCQQNVMQSNEKPSKAMQCKAMKSKAMQSNAKQCKAMLPRNRYMWHLFPDPSKAPETVTCDTFSFVPPQAQKPLHVTPFPSPLIIPHNKCLRI